MTNLRLAALLVVPLLLTGCSDDEDRPTPEPDPTPAVTGTADGPAYRWNEEPSPVVLRMPDGDVELTPYTSCWSGPPDDEGVAAARCADGMMPATEELETVAGEIVPFWFGRPGWTFTATFTDLTPCGPSWRSKVTHDGPQGFDLGPVGHAGRHRVDLFGRGPEGDVSVSFVWRMPKGPDPKVLTIRRCAASAPTADQRR